MKLVFMGTPEFSAFILEKLAEKHEVALVFTQIDKKVGRKAELTPPAVKSAAQKLGIEVFQPLKIKNNIEALDKIKAINPDYIIVAAYGKILPKEILDLAPCINTHASLLPKYRGASPIQSAIKNAESISGMSIMYMDEGLDTGDIISQQSFDIKDQNAKVVFDKMAELGASMLLEFLDSNNKHIRTKQNDALASHCGIIKKEDGLVDFSNAKSLYHNYLAFCIWPNTYLESGLKILEVQLLEEISTGEAGVILEIGKLGIKIQCEQGSLLLRQVQPAGKKPMSARDYANGKRLEVGSKFV